MWLGFCEVEVDPSPKSHARFVGELVEVSLKLTLSGALPEVGLAVKEAFGGTVEAEPTMYVSSSRSPGKNSPAPCEATMMSAGLEIEPTDLLPV